MDANIINVRKGKIDIFLDIMSVACTKWPPFCRRHYKICFLEWFSFLFKFTELCPKGSMGISNHRTISHHWTKSPPFCRWHFQLHVLGWVFFPIWLKFHWHLFQRDQLTINHYWFLVKVMVWCNLATNHCLSQHMTPINEAIWLY